VVLVLLNKWCGTWNAFIKQASRSLLVPVKLAVSDEQYNPLYNKSCVIFMVTDHRCSKQWSSRYLIYTQERSNQSET